jgi:hypothetical protein
MFRGGSDLWATGGWWYAQSMAGPWHTTNDGTNFYRQRRWVARLRLPPIAVASLRSIEKEKKGAFVRQPSTQFSADVAGTESFISLLHSKDAEAPACESIDFFDSTSQKPEKVCIGCFY